MSLAKMFGNVNKTTVRLRVRLTTTGSCHMAGEMEGQRDWRDSEKDREMEKDAEAIGEGRSMAVQKTLGHGR